MCSRELVSSPPGAGRLPRGRHLGEVAPQGGCQRGGSLEDYRVETGDGEEEDRRNDQTQTGFRCHALLEEDEEKDEKEPEDDEKHR